MLLQLDKRWPLTAVIRQIAKGTKSRIIERLEVLLRTRNALVHMRGRQTRSVSEIDENEARDLSTRSKMVFACSKLSLSSGREGIGSQIDLA